MMRRIERENTGNLRAGQDLVVAGNPGLAGAAVIAERFHSHLKTWFSGEYLEELEAAGQKAEGALEPVLAELASEITEAEPIGEGGVLKAIWNLTGAYETGVRFALRQIPVTQATVEICERFELNPYRLYSSSCALLASENGGRLAEKLKARGIEAAVIGAVRKGIAREMIVQEGQGFLEHPLLAIHGSHYLIRADVHNHGMQFIFDFQFLYLINKPGSIFRSRQLLLKCVKSETIVNTLV